MRVVFSDRAYVAIMMETAEHIKTETGGLFLGKFVGDICYVIEAIDPGPNSIFQIAYFEYDKPYAERLMNKIANLYSEKLVPVGLWHRHPGSFDKFSSTDNGTNGKFARLNKQGAISALVNMDPEFRLTVYSVSVPCIYSRIQYDIGNHLIPVELLKLKTPSECCSVMSSLLRNNISNGNGYRMSVSLENFILKVIPQMEPADNSTQDFSDISTDTESKDIITATVVDDLLFLTDQVKIEYLINYDTKALIVMQDAIDGVTELRFYYSYKISSVVMEYRGCFYKYRAGILRDTVLSSIRDADELPQAESDKNEPSEETAVPFAANRNETHFEKIKKHVVLFNPNKRKEQ